MTKSFLVGMVKMYKVESVDVAGALWRICCFGLVQND
jgi:hypothetical protein